MINAFAIEKSFGIGNYILVDSTDDFKSHFLMTGYQILLISKQQLEKNCSIADEYDFIFINVSQPWLESDCYYLSEVLKKNITIKKVALYTGLGDAEENKAENVLKVLNETFFIKDEFSIGELKVSDLFFFKRIMKKNKHKSERALQSVLVNELNKYIRSNENVAIIGEGLSCLSDFLIKSSEAQSIKTFPSLNDYIKHFELLNHDNLINYEKIDDYYDCIILLDEFYPVKDFSSLRHVGKSLCPGGRIIFTSDDFYSEELDECFEIEVTYHSKENNYFASKFGSVQNIGELDNYYVVMKSPLEDTHLFKFKEKTYLYSSPPRHLLSFENDYHNPWLIKAMVEFPTRNKNKFSLERYANKIIEYYQDDTPDYGSALAIIGYQKLTYGNRYQILNLIDGYVSRVDALENKTPHQIRWLISLSVLGGELLKMENKSQEALIKYSKAVSYDYKKFSPTIGTKVLQAYYNIAIINFCRKEKNLSLTAIDKGLEVGINLLNIEETELIGDKNSPLIFTMYIYHDILDWAIKLANLKNHLGKKNKLLPKLNGLTWSGMLRERMDAINNMESMIKSRDDVILSQGEVLEERWDAINKMNREIEAQKLLIEERWNAMQEMEQMIIERDNEILNLKKILALQ